MKNQFWRIWIGVLLIPVLSTPAMAQDAGFQNFLNSFAQEAAAQGVPLATSQKLFAGIRLNEKVLERNAYQPEFTRAVWDYLDRAASADRIKRGRELLAKHRTLLNAISAQYGVPPQYIVAIWGLESDYGRVHGDFNVIEALATLAYEGRRQKFGREQLMAALKIIHRGDIEASRLLGSWAGAMGHTQFIPTTYLGYAQDYDGDGKRDLWNSLGDVFASTANYLSKSNFVADEKWGREVKLPGDFNWDLAGRGVKKSVSEWGALGVRKADGSALPKASLQASVIAPAGHRGVAFLVYGNFRSILRYNNSTSYALAVGHLADRIIGASGLLGSWPRDDKALSREERMELQERLAARGYNPGIPDGVIGPNTRAAVKQLQRELKLVRDGHPSLEILNKLRRL